MKNNNNINKQVSYYEKKKMYTPRNEDEEVFDGERK
jgi:hypothetical protein